MVKFCVTCILLQLRNRKTTNIPQMVSQLDFELRAPPPIEHGCPCPTQRNAGPHAHRDTPSESDTCPWRRGLLHSYKGCHVWLGRLCAAQECLAERLALLPKARWRGSIHLWEGALLPNTREGAICLLSPRCWGAAQGQGVPWSHLPAWASSVQAQSLCCAMPLAGLHHRTSPSAPRAPWSPPTPHTGAFPGKFQLLVIDSSGELGRRSGAYTPSGPATHTHTDTHTWPLCQQGPLRPTSCPAAPIPADTGPDAWIQRTGLPRPHRTLHGCTTELVYAATQDTARKDTQGRPGSTPEPSPNTRAGQLPVDTQPCVSGHSRPQHPTVRQSQTPRHPGTTHSSRATPWDHTELQSVARGPPQPAAPGHAAHRP